MATTGLHPSPVPTPSGSSSSNPPTPPTQYPQFPRLPHASGSSPSIQRNASTSSTHSTTTSSSSTSSLVAVPMRPPPIETRTAATTPVHQQQGNSSSGDENAPGPGSRMGSGSEDPDSGRMTYHSPQPGYGGRGFMRNGPRSNMPRQSTSPVPPPIQTSSPEMSRASPSGVGSSPLKGKSTTLPVPSKLSPTTPRAKQAPWSSQSPSDEPPEIRSPEDPPTVTVTESEFPSSFSPRGRGGGLGSLPSSPRLQNNKPRTLSVDVRTERDIERERRMSQASNGSNSGSRKPSARDWIFGEELGRGSYSTVVKARPANLTTSNIRHDREYAVKIMNQQHLIAEKKAKYAVIERDALIRLSQPRASSTSPSTATRHKRGQSAASSSRRKSNASASGSAEKPSGAKDRLSIAISDSSSVNGGPLSPTLLSGRRPSRSAEPPAVVMEGSEERVETVPRSPVISRSRPPSPVKEESSSQGHGNEAEEADTEAPSNERTSSVHKEKISPTSTISPPDAQALKSTSTPKKRRQSLAPSERSTKTISGNKPSSVQAHPGIIRLYSTFNDNMSLYYVLELAGNGELLGLIRKYGSFDVNSVRHYGAQLIDTIEFIHERDIIHRDLKPENILLDSEMRLKVTDFGSAKILGREQGSDGNEAKKRSFVGSADFVSPEVLRNEPAVLSSDIWAFGCIIFQLLTGKPPFRGATDYLTFQKILKREFEFPTGFDEDAKALVNLILNLDPSQRPSPADIKAHPFFATCDYSSLWTSQAPNIVTGLTKPLDTLADKSNSDIWAVFDDDVSDGGFEYDDMADSPNPNQSGPHYDRNAASDAVRHVDSHDPHDFAEPRYAFQDAGSEGDGDLQPPRPSFVDASPRGKWGRGRLGSHGSGRTSSSSSTNRNALSGLLETLKLQGSPFSASGPASKGGSSRNSRTSDRSTEVNLMSSVHSDHSVRIQTPPPPPNNTTTIDHAKWSSLLLANEQILHTSTILVRPPTSIHLPSFMLPSPKRRQLILTDFPRLITVKEDTTGSGELSVQSECVFVAKGSARRGIGGETQSRVEDGTAGWVMEVQEKGKKGFTVQTILNYLTDSPELQKGWMTVLKGYL